MEREANAWTFNCRCLYLGGYYRKFEDMVEAARSHAAKHHKGERTCPYTFEEATATPEMFDR